MALGTLLQHGWTSWAAFLIVASIVAELVRIACHRFAPPTRALPASAPPASPSPTATRSLPRIAHCALCGLRPVLSRLYAHLFVPLGFAHARSATERAAHFHATQPSAHSQQAHTRPRPNHGPPTSPTPSAPPGLLRALLAPPPVRLERAAARRRARAERARRERGLRALRRRRRVGAGFRQPGCLPVALVWRRAGPQHTAGQHGGTDGLRVRGRWRLAVGGWRLRAPSAGGDVDCRGGCCVTATLLTRGCGGPRAMTPTTTHSHSFGPAHSCSVQLCT